MFPDRPQSAGSTRPTARPMTPADAASGHRSGKKSTASAPRSGPSVGYEGRDRSSRRTRTRESSEGGRRSVSPRPFPQPRFRANLDRAPRPASLVPRSTEKTMPRLTPAALLAICLVGLPIRWTAVGEGPSPLSGLSRKGQCRNRSHRSLDLLREKGVQDQLGLSTEQKVEIGHRLALTLDPDQEDLIRMILGQYHADGNRLRDLEDPGVRRRRGRVAGRANPAEGDGRRVPGQDGGIDRSRPDARTASGPRCSTVSVPIRRRWSRT